MSDPNPPNGPSTDDQASNADPAQGQDQGDNSGGFSDGGHHNADGPDD